MIMREKREALGMTIKQMAKRCECSEILLKKIEDDGWVTHPHVASRIAAEYGLDLEGYNQLVTEGRQLRALPKPVDPPDERDWRKYMQKKGGKG